MDRLVKALAIIIDPDLRKYVILDVVDVQLIFNAIGHPNFEKEPVFYPEAYNVAVTSDALEYFPMVGEKTGAFRRFTESQKDMKSLWANYRKALTEDLGAAQLSAVANVLLSDRKFVPPPASLRSHYTRSTEI